MAGRGSAALLDLSHATPLTRGRFTYTVPVARMSEIVIVSQHSPLAVRVG
jgi:hypothetical protein